MHQLNHNFKYLFLKLRSIPPTSNKSYGSVSFYDGLLLTIRVHGSFYHVNVPTSLPKRPYYLDDLTDVSQDEIDGRFMIELSGEHYLNREVFSGVHYRYKTEFMIKCLSFNDPFKILIFDILVIYDFKSVFNHKILDRYFSK